MKCKTLLLRHIGDTATLRIMDFFLDNAESDYSKKEILEHTGISKTTLYKVWDDIIEFGCLKATKKHGNAQMYSLNHDNELVRMFKNLDDALVKHAVKIGASA